MASIEKYNVLVLSVLVIFGSLGYWQKVLHSLANFRMFVAVYKKRFVP